MKYMVPYVVLRQELLNGGHGLSEQQVMTNVRKLLRAVEVDEQWYCSKYPDVKEAIANGTFKSARHHFVTDGYHCCVKNYMKSNVINGLEETMVRKKT